MFDPSQLSPTTENTLAALGAAFVVGIVRQIIHMRRRQKQREEDLRILNEVRAYGPALGVVLDGQAEIRPGPPPVAKDEDMRPGPVFGLRPRGRRSDTGIGESIGRAFGARRAP
ncbi:MAG: hypothetical protein J2P50_15500 [Hyphomicrobiaceae bacterium]|nr:hypothetical protein [Hyphomicrobiaceae bacterium]